MFAEILQKATRRAWLHEAEMAKVTVTCVMQPKTIHTIQNLFFRTELHCRITNPYNMNLDTQLGIVVNLLNVSQRNCTGHPHKTAAYTKINL